MIWLILLTGFCLLGLAVLIILRLGNLSIELDNTLNRVDMLEHDAKIDRGDY
jgi:hypothetical protein